MLQTSQAEKAILDHVLVHLLDEFFVVYRLFEISLVDPIERLKAPTIQILSIEIRHASRVVRVLNLLLPVEEILLVGLDRVNVESFVHVLLGDLRFQSFLLAPLVFVEGQGGFPGRQMRESLLIHLRRTPTFRVVQCLD